jgi:uncharacterized protein (TIGR03083 family)
MPTHLSFDDHLAALERGATALQHAATRAGLDAPVPTCPAWDIRKLVIHQGMVHRWAVANLRRERNHRTGDSRAEAQAAPDLLAWFAAGVDMLVDTLHATADDAKATVFLNDAPPPRRFWARRQAHETTIHGADATAAALGRWPTAGDVPIDPEVGADGVDELLCGFITRGQGKLRPAEPLTVVVTADDTGHAWTMHFRDGSLTTVTGAHAQPDATLSGTAAQLYLGLWNRSQEITMTGRDDFVDLWRKEVRVRWGG